MTFKLGSLALALLTSTVPAWAQSAQAGASNADAASDDNEIVVLAQRRAERRATRNRWG